MGTMETPSRAGSAETSAQAQALVNWELAASTAARLTPAGPTLGAKEIGAAVENLRLCGCSLEQLVQKDLNDCPHCGRRLPATGS